MPNTYTKKAQEALRLAEVSAKEMKQNDIGTGYLLLGLLKEATGTAAYVLKKQGVQVDKMEKLLQGYRFTDLGKARKKKLSFSVKAKEVLEDSHVVARDFKGEGTGTEHILISILKGGESTAVNMLLSEHVSLQKLFATLLQALGEDGKHYKEKFANAERAKAGGSVTVEKFSRDLTRLAEEGKIDPIIGRDDEILRLIQILSRRNKNNPCLIGEPGVGKTAIVEGLALRIANGNVPDTVKGKRVLILDLASMVAGTKYRGEFEERIKKVIKEVITMGNIIIFIDELHSLVGAGDSEGSMDASNILKPSLARGELQIIGATTREEYRKYIEKDAALERRFQPISVEEPTEEETLAILQGIVSMYESYHGVSITEEAMEAAVSMSARYINDRNLPDKAIDLLDEASSAVRMKNLKVGKKIEGFNTKIRDIEINMEEALHAGEYKLAAAFEKEKELLLAKRERNKEAKSEQKLVIVDEEDIASVVSQWTKIPVNKLTEKESLKLLQLEKTLHRKIVGQKEAVEAIAKAIRRGRVGLKDPNRPTGSFLFLGPTGVGKTELSKVLAEVLFGKKESMIRLDMSEFMEPHSVSKIIGSPPGYVGFDDGGQLCEKVRSNPYCVVLFDEVEKAHSDVFNILLQVLDDGHITDSKGRKVSFKNTIIIMTSNMGAKQIVEPKNLGFTTSTSEQEDYEKMKSQVMDEVKRNLRPEFINRIDEIMVFHSLTKEDMKNIITILAKDVSNRCKEQMNIQLSISISMKNYLVEKYFDKKMGARPLKRAIQTQIEDLLAEEVLEGKIEAGDTVEVLRKKDLTIFKKKVR